MFRETSESNDITNNQDEMHIYNKAEDFWQWYLWILRSARIVDTNYSVKGSFVWLDWGFEIYTKIYALISETYRISEHKQMQFPTLIKESIFLKETEFIRNFENDVFWVDREGQKSLEKGERLALRPTSELIIYPMFSQWIRSWRDLPLKIFQNVSIFRCETNDTRPLIRNRETIGFIEGHAALESKESAMEHLEILWKSYINLFEKLGIPIKMVEVPNWDRFAGSKMTIDGYVILPGGRSMELFTTAYLGTTFSEIFEINYLSKEKISQKAHLLCYGPSIDRILATIISYYSDNRGLILPSKITPYDIIIIPIYNKKNRDLITNYCHQIQQKLIIKNLTVKIDNDIETTPGTKFFKAERFGYPLRLEIGKKELENLTVTIFRRDNLTKQSFQFTDELFSHIQTILHDIDFMMKSRVYQEFLKHIIDLNIESLSSYITTTNLLSDRMYLLGWCGSKECAEKLEKQTNFSLIGFDRDFQEINVPCQKCGKKGRKAILCKRY